MDLEHEFLQEGVVELGSILDIDQCSNLKNQFNKLRPIDVQFFKEKVFYQERQIGYKEIFSVDSSILTKLVCLIYLLDMASIYNAIISKIDPSPVNSIDFVKKRL